MWSPATGNKPLSSGYKADPEEARKRKLGRQANQASSFADLGEAGPEAQNGDTYGAGME